MVLIYSPKTSARLTYILDEIFVNRLGMPYTIAENTATFIDSDVQIKINYSEESLPGFQVVPTSLLFETAIDPYHVPPISRQAYGYVLYPNQTQGFDIFAMAFWFLSRYEEYQAFTPDTHGRFEPKASVFKKYELHKNPSLDMALHAFYQQLQVSIPKKRGIYPTLDIDIAFKHRGRGPIRFLGGLLKNGKQDAIERIKTLFGAADPFDSFDYIHRALEPLKKQVRIFIHAGGYGTWDKPIPLRNKAYHRILQKLAQSFTIGLHPDYAGGQFAASIQKQKLRLENALHIQIDRSRQHFLKQQYPHTGMQLQEAGILHDYTMGFASDTGFRAGTAHSFRLFNLHTNTTETLIIHPFCLMDVSLKNYMQYQPEEAEDEVKRIKNVLAEIEAPFCFIFHNESLGNSGEWKNWRTVFEQCISDT